MDMTSGSIPRKLLVFSFPLIANFLLQLCFNAADMIVVGRFATHIDLAAVGAGSSLSGLLLMLSWGACVGINVLVSKSLGAKKNQETSEIVHTGIALSIIMGVFLSIFGLLFSKKILILTNVPSDVLPKAYQYLVFYCLGIVFVCILNAIGGIMRAYGDTRRQMTFMVIAGLLNVALNLVFVIRFKMAVCGVALATLISNFVACYLFWHNLERETGPCRLYLRKIKISACYLKNIIRIGLPSAGQSAMYCISNLIIQSAINTFGANGVAGNTAGTSIEGFVYIACAALSQASTSFAGQNMGAKKYDRLWPITFWTSAYAFTISEFLGIVACIFDEELLHLFSSEPEVVAFGCKRLWLLCTCYGICGVMDAVVGTLRGMGYIFLPFLILFFCACVLRVIWVYAIFYHFRTLGSLLSSYPVSWILAASVLLFMQYVLVKRAQKNLL